ncbi:hypothetical protein [Coxiella-like endosymbiont]
MSRGFNAVANVEGFKRNMSNKFYRGVHYFFYRSRNDTYIFTVD